MTPDESLIVEVCLLRYTTEHSELVSFPPGAIAGQVACRECLGSGWWGWGPALETCGPCVECKGTGRTWVGLL